MSDTIGPALPPHLRKSHAEDKDDSEEEQEAVKQSIGPAVPPWMNRKGDSTGSEVDYDQDLEDNDDAGRSVGPALPPFMQKEQGEKKGREEDSFGPSLPPGFRRTLGIGPTMPPSSYSAVVAEDDGPIIGPLPPSGNEDTGLTVAEEIEKRSKKMKDRLTGKEEPEKLEREEWMTELPPLLQGFGTGPRKFRAHARVIGDRSVWTDTPADKERKSAQKKEGENVSDQDRINIEAWAKRDSEIAQKIAHTSESERKESLMSMHDKKMKRKAEEAEASGEAKIRRPFDRELDLQTNKFDEAARKRVMKQSQGLSSRFSAGATTQKFL